MRKPIVLLILVLILNVCSVYSLDENKINDENSYTDEISETQVLNYLNDLKQNSGFKVYRTYASEESDPRTIVFYTDTIYPEPVLEPSDDDNFVRALDSQVSYIYQIECYTESHTRRQCDLEGNCHSCDQYATKKIVYSYFDWDVEKYYDRILARCDGKFLNVPLCNGEIESFECPGEDGFCLFDDSCWRGDPDDISTWEHTWSPVESDLPEQTFTHESLCFSGFGENSKCELTPYWPCDEGYYCDAPWELAGIRYGECVEIPDSDGDGILDDEDNCPYENPMGKDADADGCIDTIEGLREHLVEMYGENNPLLSISKKWEEGNCKSFTGYCSILAKNPHFDEYSDLLEQYAENVCDELC